MGSWCAPLFPLVFAGLGEHAITGVKERPTFYGIPWAIVAPCLRGDDDDPIFTYPL
jgi:hypothetical protein